VVAGHGQHPRRNRVRADVAPVSRLPCSIDAFHHRAYRHERASFGVGSPPAPRVMAGCRQRVETDFSRVDRFLHPVVQSRVRPASSCLFDSTVRGHNVKCYSPVRWGLRQASGSRTHLKILDGVGTR
jgi:hypothetical protein